jgi:hypothetical protein
VKLKAGDSNNKITAYNIPNLNKAASGTAFYFYYYKKMKEKQYDPAGSNEKSPVEGMAAVNTFNPDETELTKDVTEEKNDEQVKGEAAPEKENEEV